MPLDNGLVNAEQPVFMLVCKRFAHYTGKDHVVYPQPTLVGNIDMLKGNGHSCIRLPHCFSQRGGAVRCLGLG